MNNMTFDLFTCISNERQVEKKRNYFKKKIRLKIQFLIERIGSKEKKLSNDFEKITTIVVLKERNSICFNYIVQNYALDLIII